ncbi:hypothetical protein TTX_0167 [Thermoproteus tenax Kra 1]|uniref:Uncharacterized protein n=1 Tax=Thermoproteus tenax (strain ATCC 35583 / DSM 2078 / JCM 9277 / NBRC 100435 / Kra 1) TaxID=768679 RepID=G4RML4_THETK|nr:hypothetical protein TTX_0167 [Thermoproteus tenax Kra 1]
MGMDFIFFQGRAGEDAEREGAAAAAARGANFNEGRPWRGDAAMPAPPRPINPGQRARSPQ